MLDLDYLTPQILNSWYRHQPSPNDEYVKALLQKRRLISIEDYILNCLKRDYNYPSQPRDDIEYVLVEASRVGFLEAVKLSVHHSARPDCHNDLPIRTASYHGYTDVVKFLFGEIQWTPYYQRVGVNSYGGLNTSLKIASREGNFDIVKFLVEKGVNIHTDFDEPFLWASKRGNNEIVEFFVKRGIKENGFAVEMALSEDHFDTAILLIENGFSLGKNGMKMFKEKMHLIPPNLIDSVSNMLQIMSVHDE